MKFKKWFDDSELSLRQAAKFIGCSHQSIVHWINGDYAPSLESAIIIVRATKGQVTIKDLLGAKYADRLESLK